MLAALGCSLDAVDETALHSGELSAFEKLRVADHHHQQIVKIVRDAAGQLPERLHLARLRELFFRAP